MSEAHKYIGYAVCGGFLTLFLWALVAFIRNKTPNDRFWTLLGVLQAIIAVQVVVGAILFITGLRPAGEPTWLHYVYGGLFPASVLVAGHRFAADRFKEIPWVAFGVVAFLCFASTFRALQSGLDKAWPF